ncbi:MAG: 5-methylthioadenosine/S-adenosylhomocysteine deaminase [Ilumatobacteraceae bacterium]|nr:5-methylthioadenosine/S-adenosylhomocysteine deaminase [Ilumatobacteraceae bacterium]
MDVIIAGGDVVTMNGTRDVLVGGSVAIADGVIVAVGSTAQVRAAYPTSTVLDATDCVVTPGMINAHQHLTGDPLVRSCIPDLLPPGASIFEWSVPIHAEHTADDDELSAMLSAVESAQNGVTTVVEAGTVAHPDRVAKAMQAVGIRGTIGTWGWDIEQGPFIGTVAEVLERQQAVVEAFPTGGLVEGWVTLVGHDLASDALLAGAADLARSAGTNMTMHLSPTSSDPERYLARTGKRPVMHLQDLGVLGPQLLLAHGVWFDDEEIDLVLASRTAIAYCPWAYLRLGQGVTRVGRHAEMVERGGRVALGCDAANAGDVADILRAAALAAGLARDARLDPQRFGAHQVFELATIAGAEAIGMADRIGSLEVGKQADIVVHDATNWGWSPRGDVGLQLVWGTDGRSVRDVFIAGQPVIRDGACVTVDAPELRRAAQAQQHSLLQRAGITIPHAWPHVDAR